MAQEDIKSIPMDKRFLKARVSHVGPGDIVMMLPAEFKWGTQARIVDRDLPEGKKPTDFSMGDWLDIFVMQNSRKDQEFFYASLKLADKKTNPWLTGTLAFGEIVTGTAVSYDSETIVIVALDQGVEVSLPRFNFPGEPTEDIRKIIHIGDRISALVAEVDRTTLGVEISVNALIEKNRQEEKACRTASWKGQGDSGQAKKKIPIALPPYLKALNHHFRVLIVDNNRNFGNSIREWLTLQGAYAWFVSTPQAMEREVAVRNPTHILLDYDLGDAGLNIGVRKIARQNNNIPTCIISGGPDSKPDVAVENNWGFLRKPVSNLEILDWLKRGALPSYQEKAKGEQRPNLWSGPSLEGDFRDRANNFLEKLCQEHQCLGALWVRKRRKDVYGVRAMYGLDPVAVSEFRDKIHLSLLGTKIIEENREHEVIGHASTKDPLRRVAPEGADFEWGFPLNSEVEGRFYTGTNHDDEEGNNQASQALLFFRNKSFDEDTKKAILQQKPRLKDLVERLLLLRALDESEAFASVGRAESGLMHELRTGIDTMARGLENLVRKADRLDKDRIMDQINKLDQNCRKLASLSKTKLSLIQKERPERVKVDETLHNILKNMEDVAREQNVRLELTESGPNMSISMQPQAFEQPLVNLLVNALYHVRTRTWGRVRVWTGVDGNDPKTPFHVFVSDNGLGMNAEQRGKLFDPRSTSKGKEGIGMGLYLSRNLVRSIGGDLVLVESIRYVGSTFCLKLPLKLADSD